MRPFHALLVSTLLVSALLTLALLWRWQEAKGDKEFGATFSPQHARYLGLDAGAAYRAMFDDLGIRLVRIPAYWNQIEAQPGEYTFADLDWYMDQAAERRGKIVLAIGNKVPRWPECHMPDWARELDHDEYSTALTNYLTALVERYKTHPALYRWQVENEASFVFGECPPYDPVLFNAEVDLVRKLDPYHPIQITVSGEQELWFAHAWKADVLGTSLYRRAHHPLTGYFTFPHPPVWYTMQGLLTSLLVDRVVISELQAEPWLVKDYREYTTEELHEMFNERHLQRYVRFAERSGIQEVTLWGVEWWYYLKQKQYPEVWETAKRIITEE